MKKLACAATMLLTVFAFTATSCGGDQKKEESTAKTEVKGEQKGDSYETTTNIRYIDRDTLLAHYDYAVEQSKIIEQIDLDLQAYQNQLGRNLQNKQASMQQKMNSNAYTEATYKADMEELQRMDQNSQQQYQRRAMNDAQRVEQINRAVKEAVDAYIVKFNAEKKYDAILYKDAGLYFNPALDITGELVKGLNEEYKANKGKTGDTKEADGKAAK